ncbi:ammonium transporter [Obelidium mucronatum]|nr:ammonium transporter [Obelidium mucronatum]
MGLSLKALFVTLALAQAACAQNATTEPVSPVDNGDVAWILISSALVFIMVPGLGLFYSGLAETKNSMAMLLAVMLSFAIAAIQWSLFGFTLAFSDTSSSTFIGNFEYAALLNTMDTQNKMAPTIPNSLFSLYQMMFAAITPGLFLGATAGRMRMLPTMVFVGLWCIFVYNPVAYWVWSSNGWLRLMNVMDYAGGSVVHVTSGTTAFILAYRLGKRSDFQTRNYVNHNPTFVYMGTALLWFGWNGFNGGSSLAANNRGVNAAYASNLAACIGGLVWMLLDIVVNKKGFSAVGFCTGAIAGLATITPGSGFVQPGFGLVYGIVAAFACFYSIKFMHWLKVDDSLDVTAVHGVGGALGMVLTGIFAQYSASEGATAGWIDQVWIQVPVQLAAVAVIGLWSAFWTSVLIVFMDSVLQCKLRCSSEAELVGLDLADIGEEAYPFANSSDMAAKEDDVDVEKGFIPVMSHNGASQSEASTLRTVHGDVVVSSPSPSRL